MATCDPTALLESACELSGLNRRELQIVMCQLLCELVAAGGVGGGSTYYSGTDANPNGIVTGNEGQIYVDYRTNRIWVKTEGSGDGNNTGWV